MLIGSMSRVSYRFIGGLIGKKRIVYLDPKAWQMKHRSFCTISRVGFDNYEKLKSSWDISIPENFNFASDVIDVWARKEQEGTRDVNIPALWFVSETGQEKKWNYQELQHETKRIAQMLQEKCGIKRGDNIMVMLPKIAEFFLMQLAAIRIGAVMSPTTVMLTAKDLSYRFSTFRPVCIIAHESVVETVDQASAGFSTLKSKVVVSASNKRKEGWLDFHCLQKGVSADHKCAETRSDEIMLIYFTSGTTGYPKMVEQAHGSYSLGQKATGMVLQDLTSKNIHWNFSDTGWAKTIYGVFGPWWCGAGIFVHHMPRFDPTLTLQVLAKYPIDTFCAAPLIYRSMTKQILSNYTFSKLEHCIAGGDSLTSEDVQNWKDKTGLKLYVGYGQSETVAILGQFKCIDFRPGSLGKPMPGSDVVILDENENELGPDVTGEIALKKRNGKILGLFKGYRDEPEKTMKVITENYYHTGDLGYYDKDGYFWFVGRNDDVIKSSGYRIGPSEVESVLMDHPIVAEAAVISSPDKERGEVVKAFVVLKDTPQSEESKSELIKELQDHCKKSTAPYKYPRKIEFIKELPKTVNGKIKRFELRKLERNNCN